MKCKSRVRKITLRCEISSEDDNMNEDNFFLMMNALHLDMIKIGEVKRVGMSIIAYSPSMRPLLNPYTCAIGHGLRPTFIFSLDKDRM